MVVHLTYPKVRCTTGFALCEYFRCKTVSESGKLLLTVKKSPS
jgi:hypothetical protein